MRSAARHLAASPRTARIQPLPNLLDCAGLMRELGVTRAAAEALMRRLPVVEFDGLRKVYVRREDVHTLIEESTREK
jgi:hypothetical protein